MKGAGWQKIGQHIFTFTKEPPSILSSVLTFLYLRLNVKSVRVIKEEDHRPT